MQLNCDGKIDNIIPHIYLIVPANVKTYYIFVEI